MSVSELAEAIKIKSVLRTNEKLEIGDTVEIIKNSTCGEKGYEVGDIRKVTELYTSNGLSVYLSGVPRNIVFNSDKVRLTTKQPKAEWIDITNKCEFKPRYDGVGFVLRVLAKDKFIGHLGLDGFYITDTDYKVEESGTQFKILKEVSK